MRTKLIALLLGAALLAGCAAGSSASSDAAESSSGAAEYAPSYTYVNPDPDMILVSVENGENVTYKDYRLYLDISEQMNRFTSRQTMAMCAALERDFKTMGIAIDEAEYEDMAQQQMMQLLLYSPSLSSDIKAVAEATGMTEQEAQDAMLLSFRAQYLITRLGAHFEEQAKAEYTESAESSSSQSASSDTSSESSAPETPEQAAERKEKEKAEAISNSATQKMADYSNEYSSRLGFDDDSVLASFDGEAIAYTDEVNKFIEYSAAASRIDAAAFIQSGELALRALESSGAALPDKAEFESSVTQYVSQMRGDAEFMKHLEKFCARYNATCDDYFKALERPLWIETAGNSYYDWLMSEYERLAADSGSGVPEYADQYCVDEMNRLTEGTKVINVLGK